jgi:NCS1 family nucleobase:cation symporter-1
VFDKSRRFEWGFVAWLVGVIASSPFWTSPLYTGPIAAAHPGWGDLSMYVAAVIAIVMYFATFRLPSLAGFTLQRGHTKIPPPEPK